MFRRGYAANAVKLALVGSAVTMAVSSPAIYAAEDDESVERIEVTGSRIKRADMENASPITMFSREDIESSGVTNIGQLLQTTSQADLSGLTQMSNNTNANDGTQTISLRNLGSDRTLTLVDGRRFLALGGGQVDISTIPLAIVERVEILADGASAVYGSDAIAGVVNIITKDGFDGVQAEIGAGANFEGDGESKNYGLSIGTQTEKTNLFLNINKVEEDPILAGDREISKYPVAGIPQRYGSFFGLYGVFLTDDGFLSLDPAKEGAGMRTADDFVPMSNANRYNYAPTNYLYTPSDRFSVFAKADTELTDNIRGFAMFQFNQRKSVTQIAAVPLVAGFSGPQWDITYSKDNIYNPFGQDLDAWGFRTLPIGPRTSIQDYDTYFLNAGFEGDFELADRMFSWDISWSRGEASRTERGENYVNLQNLANAVGPSFVEGGIAQCGTPDDPIAGCVPLNLFNGVTGFTDEMADYVGYSFVQTVDTGMNDISANLSGEIVELPAGMMAFAVGFERRTNTYADSPDSLISAGLSSTNFREATSGSQTATEGYFELAIPVLADIPAFKSLEVTVAGRTSDFENGGFVGENFVESEFDNTSFKYGFTWRVIDDLMLRGNFSDTFRAPSVDNLYAGGGEGFPQAQDPCNSDNWDGQSSATQQRCIAAGVPDGGSLQPTTQLRALNGGNPFLEPEEGETKTLGLVYDPEWLDGFDMSVDYWQIELNDALTSIGASGMLNRCYVQGLDEFCPFIERRADGRVETVRTTQFNLSQLETSGYDFTANYKFETDGLGDFGFRLSGSYTDEYKTAGENESISDAENQVGAVNSDIFKLRGTFSTTWNYDDLSVVWQMRYTSDLTENCWVSDSFVEDGLAEFDVCNRRDQTSEDNPNGLNRIGSVVYHDLSASYNLPWNANVRVGVRNLFRKEPPISINVFANSFYQAHDIPGGTWFAHYKQDF